MGGGNRSTRKHRFKKFRSNVRNVFNPSNRDDQIELDPVYDDTDEFLYSFSEEDSSSMSETVEIGLISSQQEGPDIVGGHPRQQAPTPDWRLMCQKVLRGTHSNVFIKPKWNTPSDQFEAIVLKWLNQQKPGHGLLLHWLDDEGKLYVGRQGPG